MTNHYNWGVQFPKFQQTLVEQATFFGTQCVYTWALLMSRTSQRLTRAGTHEPGRSLCRKDRNCEQGFNKSFETHNNKSNRHKEPRKTSSRSLWLKEGPNRVSTDFLSFGGFRCFVFLGMCSVFSVWKKTNCFLLWHKACHSVLLVCAGLSEQEPSTMHFLA